MCSSEKCAPWALLLMRLVTGAVLLNHGWPKLFGDKAGLLGFFGHVFPFAPAFMLGLTGVIEVVGGILLILGLFNKYVTPVLVVEFIYIVIAVKSGFGPREIDLLMLSSVFALWSMGAGSISLDAKMMKKGGDSAPSAPMQS